MILPYYVGAIVSSTDAHFNDGYIHLLTQRYEYKYKKLINSQIYLAPCSPQFCNALTWEWTRAVFLNALTQEWTGAVFLNALNVGVYGSPTSENGKIALYIILL